MKRSALLRTSLCVLASVCSLLAASAPAQLANGGFEDTPDFAGWTVNDPTLFTLVGHDSAFAYGGTAQYANLGASPTFGSLSQTFNTTAGELYNVSFALANYGNTTGEFDVLWNGTPVFTLVDPPMFGNYIVFSIDNLSAPTSSTTLEFRYRNDSDFFSLDSVTVGVVPEPATLSFVFLGLGAFAAVSYRRNKFRRSA